MANNFKKISFRDTYLKQIYNPHPNTLLIFVFVNKMAYLPARIYFYLSTMKNSIDKNATYKHLKLYKKQARVDLKVMIYHINVFKSILLFIYISHSHFSKSNNNDDNNNNFHDHNHHNKHHNDSKHTNRFDYNTNTK